MATTRAGDYVAFDLETTGLMAETDRVVEIGAVRFDAAGVERDRFEQLVHPERRMAPAAQAIHGISDAMLAAAPPARAVLPAFVAWLGDPARNRLIAHHAAFDAGFLGRELGRAGLDAPGHAVFDTLALARRRVPDLADHRLDTLARLYDLDPGGPHRALADSQRVRGLWVALGGPTEPETGLVSYPIVTAARRAGVVPNGWDDLADAVARGLRVRIEYNGGSRGAGPREITPRCFTNRGGIGYLVAFCHLDAFEKSFRLDRVQRYEVIGRLDPPQRHQEHKGEEKEEWKE